MSRRVLRGRRGGWDQWNERARAVYQLWRRGHPRKVCGWSLDRREEQLAHRRRKHAYEPFQHLARTSEFAPNPYHLSHLIPGFPISPPSCFGSDPPDKAIVNRPFFAKASFCALRTKSARASTSSALDGKEVNTGGMEVWGMF